jgi:antibiotic biosynthesis monooxygenase (ABM) superfamily enzyme
MFVRATNSVQSSARAAASASAQPTRFSRPRFALLVLLGVYPLITLLLYVILPLTEAWPIWQRTLVIAPIMVSIMVWGLIPGVQKFFRGFINPALR